MLKVEWKHLNKQINIWLVMAVYLLGAAISLKMGGTYIDSHLITRAEYYTSFFETFEGKWNLERQQAYEHAKKDVVTEQYVNYVADNPKDRYLIPQTGWEAWIGGEHFDPVTILLLIVLSCYIVTNDHEAGVAVWKLNTQQKRQAYKRIWCVELLGISVGVMLLDFVLQWLYYQYTYGLSDYDAPVQSLWSFEHSTLPFSLFQTAVLIQIMKFFGFLFVLILSQMIAAIIKRFWISCAVNIFLIAAPYLLFNRETLRYIIQPMGMLLSGGYLKGNTPQVLYDGVQVGWPACGLSNRQIIVLTGIFFVVTAVCYVCYLVPVKTMLKYKMQIGMVALCLLVTGLLAGIFIYCYPNSEEKGTNTYYSLQPQYSEADFYVQDGSQIMQYSKDGKKEAGEDLVYDVFCEEIDGFHVCDRSLYYYQQDNNSGKLHVYRMDRKDGSYYKVYEETRGIKNYNLTTRYLGLVNEQNYHNESVEDDAKDLVSNLWVSDGYIYITDKNSIERICLSTKKKEIVEEQTEISDSVAYDGTWIYYVDEESAVRAINPDTGQVKKYDVTAQGKLCVAGEKIYYVGKDALLYELSDKKTSALNQRKVAETSRISAMEQCLVYVSDKGELVQYHIRTGQTERIDSKSNLLDVIAYPGHRLYCYTNEDEEYKWSLIYVLPLNYNSIHQLKKAFCIKKRSGKSW